MNNVFPKKEPFTFVWTITDPTTSPPTPIDDCDSVTATLYAGRSASDPDFLPGTVVAAFENLTLTHTSNGQYQVEVGTEGEFDPPASTNYRIVVVATRSASPFGWWEEDASVVVNS